MLHHPAQTAVKLFDSQINVDAPWIRGGVYKVSEEEWNFTYQSSVMISTEPVNQERQNKSSNFASAALQYLILVLNVICLPDPKF